MFTQAKASKRERDSISQSINQSSRASAHAAVTKQLWSRAKSADRTDGMYVCVCVLCHVLSVVLERRGLRCALYAREMWRAE